MIIVLTPEQDHINEVQVLQELFDAGLDLYHIRKHWLNEEDMKAYLNTINPKYYERLVLHSHHHMASAHGISRLHFREADREAGTHSPYIKDHTLSTSVHDIHAFNRLDKAWSYAFLSPVYPSISKQGYGHDHTVLETIAARDNPPAQLIGLGGIDASNCSEVLLRGADGIALLGSVWQAADPVDTFRNIQKACFSMRSKKQDI